MWEARRIWSPKGYGESAFQEAFHIQTQTGIMAADNSHSGTFFHNSKLRFSNWYLYHFGCYIFPIESSGP
jgi:hypothetical protein